MLIVDAPGPYLVARHASRGICDMFNEELPWAKKGCDLELSTARAA